VIEKKRNIQKQKKKYLLCPLLLLSIKTQRAFYEWQNFFTVPLTVTVFLQNHFLFFIFLSLDSIDYINDHIGTDLSAHFFEQKILA